MKHEWTLALGASVFLGITAVLYFAWSGETSGSVMLLFGCLAYALLGGWILMVFLRRGKAPRAEDRPDATQEQIVAAARAAEAPIFAPCLMSKLGPKLVG